MPGGDPANSPRASTRVTPADSADSLQDLLAEPLLLAHLAEPRLSMPRRESSVQSMPSHVVEWQPLSPARIHQLVEAQIHSAGLDPRDGSRAATSPQPRRLSHAEIVEILTMLSCDENHTLAIRALCWLRYMEKEGRSLDAIGAEYGVVRATVQAIDKSVKQRYAQRGVILTSRADKSPESREACRLRRLGKRKKRQPWKFAHLCQNPIPIPLR